LIARATFCGTSTGNPKLELPNEKVEFYASFLLERYINSMA